ncbi:collagen binding domain-containing protein [Microbacterium sp. NPDC090218]
MTRRRGMLRAVLGGLAAFALAVGGATAAVAEDEPIVGTGSISGTVTAAVGGSPLAGIEVRAQLDGDSVSITKVTNANGAYTFSDLDDGSYLVRFSDPGGYFDAEYWNGARDARDAQRITVTDGSVHTGINAALVSAPSSSISGTVTRADDATPVAGVSVTAQGADGYWASTSTDAAGKYTLGGLPGGSYVVGFHADGTDLKREYWPNAFDYSQAVPFTIADHWAAYGIDAALDEGGAIQGVVTSDVDGSPLEGVAVRALDDRNEIVGATQTDAVGAYTLGGLPAGSYRLEFDSADPAVVSEYWNDSHTWAGATLITVIELETVADVDASLAGLGFISGTVTRSSDGEPLSASVSFYGIDGGVDVSFVDTESDGTFRVPVVPGTYRVLFHPNERGMPEEYWKDAFLWEDATLITVAAGQEVVGIDAAMDEAATIAGTVTLDSDVVQKIVVEAWSGDVKISSTHADIATGAYSLVLPKGTYVLKATAAFTDGTTTAKPQFFDGVATAAEATPIAALAGATVAGIDFTLITGNETEPKPVLTLSAGSIRAGKDITVSGTGFAPGATIAFELHSDPIKLGTLTADAGGALQGTLRIPAGAPAGTHTLVALSGTTVIASATLTVAAAGTAGQASGGATAPGTGLASTGADAPVGVVVAGLLLAVLGGLLVRRRRVES